MKTSEVILKAMCGGYDRNFTYLFGHSGSGELALVDCALPWNELSPLVDEALSQHSAELTAIFITHGHHDHLISLNSLVARFPMVRIYAHHCEQERIFLACKVTVTHPLTNEDPIEWAGDRIQILHTPGHQPGCICYIWRGHCFTGDTLFVETCGNCHLPGGDLEAQLRSLQRMANELPDDLILLPGHDYGSQPNSTIARELLVNPYMQGLRGDDLTGEIEQTWLDRRSGRLQR